MNLLEKETLYWLEQILISEKVKHYPEIPIKVIAYLSTKYNLFSSSNGNDFFSGVFRIEESQNTLIESLKSEGGILIQKHTNKYYDPKSIYLIGLGNLGYKEYYFLKEKETNEKRDELEKTQTEISKQQVEISKNQSDILHNTLLIALSTAFLAIFGMVLEALNNLYEKTPLLNLFYIITLVLGGLIFINILFNLKKLIWKNQVFLIVIAIFFIFLLVIITIVGFYYPNTINFLNETSTINIVNPINISNNYEIYPNVNISNNINITFDYYKNNSNII